MIQNIREKGIEPQVKLTENWGGGEDPNAIALLALIDTLEIFAGHLESRESLIRKG